MNYEELKAGHGQTLEQHLQEVEEKLSQTEARYAGLLHDIGKTSQNFQKYIYACENKEKPKTHFRHAIGSLPIADYILRKQNDKNRLFKLLAIYFHHSKISFDMLQNDLIRTNNLNDANTRSCLELKKDEIKTSFELLEELFSKFNYEWKGNVDEFLNDIDREGGYINYIQSILKEFFKEFEEINEKDKQKFSTIYYNLVSSDWASSGKREGGNIEWDKIRQEFYEEFWNKRDETDIRTKIQNRVAAESKDFIYLVAPTGSGKSEASLYWALKKAEEKNAEKIIYVLPFKALIDDLYKRFDSKYIKKKVLLWHSDYLSDFLEKVQQQVLTFDSLDDFSFYKTLNKYFVNSEKPIIITTADQILMSFLNVSRYPIRRGLFKDAIFVFDEVQSYGALMRGLIYDCVLNVEPKACLMMTATPPGEFIGEKTIKIKIGNKEKLFEKIEEKNWIADVHEQRNCKISFHILDNKKSTEEKEFNEIIKILKNNTSHKKICILLNTIPKVKNLFNKIKDNKNKIKTQEIILLHSNLIEEARIKRIEKISELDEFIVITTQVLEAGVDVSFDLMVRELAPLPSLVQAMGRVNRNGDCDNAEIHIVLFDPAQAKQHLPYEKSEMIATYEKLKTIEAKTKVDLEYILKDDLLKNSKKEFTDEIDLIEYYSSMLEKLIWSVKNIEVLLGMSLRNDECKTNVFVEKEGSKEELLKELKELKEKIKKGKDKTESIEKYLSILVNLRKYVISIPYYKSNGKKSISWKEYVDMYDPSMKGKHGN